VSQYPTEPAEGHRGSDALGYGSWRLWSPGGDKVNWGTVETEGTLVSNPVSPKVRLTGSQKWLIAGLIVLQVPSSAIFYPLAALFALTGIGIPLSIVFLGVGTMPFSLAMKRKVAWQSGQGPKIEDRQTPGVVTDE
jgi:hypothetical protein